MSKIKPTSFLLALALLASWAVLPAQAREDAPEQAERVTVGAEAPPLSLLGSDGETYTLEALEGEKNAVLVFFRGTW